MLTLNVSTAAALTLLLFAPAADVPRFVCKEGVTVKRTLEMKGKRELTKFTMRVAEESQDRDDIHRAVELSAKQVVRDEVRSCADGRVASFSRTYVTLDKNRTENVKAPDGERVLELPETSDLAGKTVAFTREGAKKWKRTIDDEANEELTADLEADMDYLAFLPEKDAAPGAKWDVDFADVKTALLRPGGEIPFHGKEEVKAMDKRLRKLAWESTAGKLSLELGSVHEEDGHKLVAIDFKGDMGYDASTKPEGDEQGPKNVRIEDAQKLEGKLVWNLDAGRAQSIEWTAKGQITLTVSGTGKKQDGTEIDVDQIQQFDEEYTYTGTFAVQ